MTPIQADIERRLAVGEADVEVLLAEGPAGPPLELGERVTLQLSDLREGYSLEVSPPGSERPLTKPAHFRRFVGRRARVRTRHERPLSREAGETGRTAKSFTGELVGASEEEVTLAADGGVIAIP